LAVKDGTRTNKFNTYLTAILPAYCSVVAEVLGVSGDSYNP
jgi:hypothetical protein